MIGQMDRALRMVGRYSMYMLRYRLTLGPLLILLMIGIFWADSQFDRMELTGFWETLSFGRTYFPAGIILFILSVLVIPIAAWELSRILQANGIAASALLTAIAAETGLVIHYCIPQDTNAMTAVAVVSTCLVGMFVLALMYYSKGKNVEGVVAAAGGTMFAMIYLGFMLGFFLALRRWHPSWMILAIIMVTKMCDTGAFFVGSSIGKHKLIPWLSPKKTWEGLIGGLATSALVAALLAMWGQSLGEVEFQPGQVYQYSITPWVAAGAGALIGLVGQAGDLTASLFKRDAGIKDSSSLLPGFGGVLDLLDSPLLVAPVAYWIFHGNISG